MWTDQTKEPEVYLSEWYQDWVQTPRSWSEIEERDFPYLSIRVQPEEKAMSVTELLKLESTWIQWLFENYSPAVFAIVVQHEKRKGLMLLPVFGLKSWASKTNPCYDLVYATGFIYQYDLLGVDFKLRFGDIICA
jgi:hypothetical protein